MKLEDVIKKLRGHIYSEFETASNYANSKGVSKAYISSVLTGKREPSDGMLSDIGIKKEKQTIYKKA